MSELLNDKRFAHIARDPKFKRIPKSERKIKIDKRFKSMFNDKKFTVQYTTDKRGRPVNQTSSENLRKYYDLSSSEDEDGKEHERPKQQKKNKSKDYKKKEDKVNTVSKLNENSKLIENKNEDINSSDNNCFSSNEELLRIKPKEECDIDSEEQSDIESDSTSDIDYTTLNNLKADIKESKQQLNIKNKSEEVSTKVKKKLADLSINYARGEGVLITDSSSDDEESSESPDEQEIEHNWGELDKEAETTNEITHRLAVCNMDWDRLRAEDLMVLFHSFLPLGGIIHSVTIYPSEFGLQRLKEEEIKGPKELTESKKEEEIEDKSDNEEGSSYHMEKLRQYQLNRLKYYYAVVDFDSAETANKIYMECDGTEYESTATKLDLRFISDDMEFDQIPKEVCSKLPELTKYKPRQFTTTALQQVKVHLTWDETNPERMEIAEKLNSGKLNEINENDLQAYLAINSSDDESVEETEQQQELQEDKNDLETKEPIDPVEKYKALLKEIEEKEESKQKKDVELEFTWGLGTKEKAEKLVQERLKKDQNLTPFEQYLEKRKEKKKAKREERKKHKNTERDTINSDDSDILDSDNNENNRTSHKKINIIENNNLASSGDDDEEQRKAELELLLMDENQDGKQHFNMKKIEEHATMTKSKQKRLNKKKNAQEQIEEDKFEVNVQDSRFNALFTSHHFNIDPADPHYRKTKGTEALIKEKLKRRADNEPNEEIPAKESKMKSNAELQKLIKSVKKNTKNITKPIK